MNPKQKLILNIAGQRHDVLFDGEAVYDTLFPDQKIERIRACGFYLTQANLVEVCEGKLGLLNA